MIVEHFHEISYVLRVLGVFSFPLRHTEHICTHAMIRFCSLEFLMSRICYNGSGKWWSYGRNGISRELKTIDAEWWVCGYTVLLYIWVYAKHFIIKAFFFFF